MKRLAQYRPSPATAIALAALIVAIGGAAYATIPDSSGRINACYGTSNGNLRVVESAGDCRTNETAIRWNQQGPPGPPGALATVFDERTPEVSTASREFVDLGGPEVNITVGPSGLVAVVARAEVHGSLSPPPRPGDFSSVTSACLGLFVDSQPYRDAGLLNCSGGGASQFSEARFEWRTFEAVPGNRTVTVRYRARCDIASAGCPTDDRAFFRNRKLWVVPLG